MSSELVVVYTASGPALAEILKSTLEAAGIPAQLSREGAGAVYGLTVGPLGLVDILVTADRAAEASALLESVERGELSDDEPTED